MKKGQTMKKETTVKAVKESIYFFNEGKVGKTIVLGRTEEGDYIIRFEGNVVGFKKEGVFKTQKAAETALNNHTNTLVGRVDEGLFKLKESVDESIDELEK